MSSSPSFLTAATTGVDSGLRATKLGKKIAIQLVQLVSPFVDTSSEKLAVQPEKANADGIF